MKEDAFGRVNAEASEQFRVLERQLDHLTHFLKLLTDTADVFVGDALGLPNVFLGNGFVFDDNLGVGGHHNDALGDGLDHSKGQGLGEEGHAGDEDAVAGHDRTLGKASLGEPFDAGSELDLLLVRHDGRDGEFRAGLGFHLADRDTVAEADTGVLANDTVHAYDVHLRIFGPAAPVNGGRGALFTADFDEIARFEVKSHLRGDACPSESDVGGDGFGYAQFDGVVLVCHTTPSSRINISRYIMKFKRVFRRLV